MRKFTRSDRVLAWIEKYCVHPSGIEKGQRVRLSKEARETVRMIYDGMQVQQVDGDVAGYLALLHTAGPEAVAEGPRPVFVSPIIDVSSVWNSTGPELRAVLRRDGELIRCPQLGTRYPLAA